MFETPCCTAATSSLACGDLDGWLQEREARFADLRPDCAKHIQWAGMPGSSTEVSLVYLHGFSASRREVSPLCENVAAALGCNLFMTRLTGHGRGSAAMGEGSVAAWKRDALEALAIGARLGRQVIVVGTSQGGSLAAWLGAHCAAATVAGPGASAPAAAEPAQHLAGLVLIAPNFGLRNPFGRLLRWPGRTRWVPWIMGKERIVPVASDGHAACWTTRYPTTALFPMIDLAVEARAALAGTRTPVELFFAPDDQVVSSAMTGRIVAASTTAAVRTTVVADSDDPSQHVIAGEIFSPGNQAAMEARLVTAVRRICAGATRVQAAEAAP